MAAGDDALAAGMDLVPGTALANTLDTEINKTRDYIAQRTATVTPIAKGGTGATTAPAARTALGIELAAIGSVEVNKIPSYTAAGRLVTNTPAARADVANKAYVDAVIGAPELWFNKVNVQGKLYALGATAAVSGYTIAYIDGDGQVSKGASSERYKEDIQPLDPAALGDIWPVLHSYRMAGGDGSARIGYIAERLAENPDTAPFVVYADINGETLPDSIDFIGLLIAQNAQLHQALDLLAQRLDTLEGRA